MFNGQKIRVAVVILIAIICCAVVFFTNKNRIMKMPMVLGTIGQNKIGEGAEPSSGAFSLSSNDTVGASIDTSKWDLNRVNIVYDTENTPVPVPKGFTASGAEGEHTVNTGFVIYEGEGEVNDENAWDESCTRNQFVWVPVYDTSRVCEEIGNTGKKKAKLWEFTSTGIKQLSNNNSDKKLEPGMTTFQNFNMQGYTRESLYKELEIGFQQDMESIEKYGGFYIGRYETGNVSKAEPVVQRMNTNISNQTWYKMYPKLKNISTNKNVIVKMIWGCLWDETIQWLIGTNSITEHDTYSGGDNKGNSYYSYFEYINISGEIVVKKRNTDVKIPTGSAEISRVNNIYDMIGNVCDWTLESSNTTRNLRGGSYGHMSYGPR